MQIAPPIREQPKQLLCKLRGLQLIKNTSRAACPNRPNSKHTQAKIVTERDKPAVLTTKTSSNLEIINLP